MKDQHALILVGIVIFDILVARVLIVTGFYIPPKKIEQYYRIKDPVFHHALKKNITYSDAIWGSMGYTVNTNSLGFKDRSARQIPLQSDNTRIVFIGDSFTEGVGFSYKNSFVGLVEKQFASKNIEVLNAAVSSYSPIVYYRKIKYYIEEVGLKFDQLVLFMDISDIQDEILSYSFDNTGNVVAHTLSKENELDEKLKHFIASNTIFLSNLRIFIRKLKKKTPSMRVPKHEDSVNVYRSLWTIKDDVYSEYGKEGVALAKKRMNMLSELLKKNNIKLTVVVYPWPDQIWHKDLDSKQVKIWKKWAQSHNAGFINLFPYFVDIGEPLETLKKYYIVGDIHWNAAGHKLVADKFLQNFLY